MAAKISRRRRAEMARAAQRIRARGQRAGWPIHRIAATIELELPQVLPLEAWRWAHGWSRAQTLAEISHLFTDLQLGTAAATTSMLCRWEHGEIAPKPDYAAALCEVYGVDLVQLGLWPTPSWRPALSGRGRYGAFRPTTSGNEYPMTPDDTAGTLQAVRESVELELELEGPAGGPGTLEQLEAAVSYYDLQYSKWAPGVLATEVHRTRALVAGMLHQEQTETARRDLRRLAGWLSALVGNLAFHLDDIGAATLHLATAERLGAAAGDTWLQRWTLGARAMIANDDEHYSEAIELSRRAYEHAKSPLRRAQILAWAQLRPTAALGEGQRSEVARISGAAVDWMSSDPDGDRPGRFGFDTAELELHLGEAALLAGDHGQARGHAESSLRSIPHGRPGWVAATLVLARAEAGRGRHSDAAALAMNALDAVSADRIRANSRTRFQRLNDEIAAAGGTPAAGVQDLRDRVIALPSLAAAGRQSEEPNGV